MNRWLLILIPGILILAWSVNRDIRYSRAYPGDLRNRVVGARLIEDGRLPYFYKWKTGDGTRYYDPENFNNLAVSNITGSPFFHRLMMPLAGLPQASIIWIWLLLEYLCLAAMTALCLLWAETTEQKQWVLVFSLLFLLTNAWKGQVAAGQIYWWIPALALGFYACIRRTGSLVGGLAAGAIAGVLVLIRINTVFFFLPFLFLAGRYTRRWWLAFIVPLLLLGGWTFGSREERDLWRQYEAMMQENVRMHQGLSVSRAQNDPDPRYPFWEGIDMQAANRLTAEATEKLYSENGNVFMLFGLLFHRRLPPIVWEISGLILIAMLCLAFWFLHRPFSALTLSQLAIFAFCVYMISDLFSPVYRHQYYTVQWLFPLLLAAASRRRAQWAPVLCLIVLSFHFPLVKMQNTIAEYALMAVLLAFTLRPEKYCTQGG